MWTAVCTEDEQERSHLLELLAEYQSLCGEPMDCHSFPNSTDFLCDMKGGEYDLILMDIQMPGRDGIRAAQELRERDQSVRLIFVSASPEFAVESYHVGAYHYLLKPVDAADLFPLLDRIRGELSWQEEQGLVLRSREGVVRIAFSKLEYVEVMNKTVSFHLTDGAVYEVTAALADFEEKLLSRPEFIKTHRAYLLNLGCIQAIGAGGAVTKSGHRILVSRQRRSRLQEAYMQYQQQSKRAVFVPPSEETHSDGPWRILLVDDDPAARACWSEILKCHGCMVQEAENGEDAARLAKEENCDCVLLDVMLPGEDGFSICERLHKLTGAPVIFLSSRTEAEQQLKGFTSGGIDYITKDTPGELFWAKVEAHIRLAKSERTQFCYGPLLLDLKNRRSLIHGKELSLTPAEFDLLLFLSGHTGHIFTPEEIASMLWGRRPGNGGQEVQIHMSRLRRKLEQAWSGHCFIETVWGQGYCFVPVRQ